MNLWWEVFRFLEFCYSENEILDVFVVLDLILFFYKVWDFTFVRYFNVIFSYIFKVFWCLYGFRGKRRKKIFFSGVLNKLLFLNNFFIIKEFF